MSAPSALYTLLHDLAVDHVVSGVPISWFEKQLGLHADTITYAFKKLMEQGCVTVSTRSAPSSKGTSRRDYILHKPYVSPSIAPQSERHAVRAAIYPLYMQGLSISEIGKRLGKTRNSIIGQTHRMMNEPHFYPGMESRPSPIRRSSSPKPPKPPRAPKATLAPLASIMAPPPSSMITAAHDRRIAETVITAKPLLPWRAPPVIMAPARSRPESVPKRYGRVVECCWPIDEPGTKEFHFCDVPSEPGRPYCQSHVRVAYERVRDQREDHPNV